MPDAVPWRKESSKRYLCPTRRCSRGSIFRLLTKFQHTNRPNQSLAHRLLWSQELLASGIRTRATRPASECLTIGACRFFLTPSWNTLDLSRLLNRARLRKEADNASIDHKWGKSRNSCWIVVFKPPNLTYAPFLFCGYRI